MLKESWTGHVAPGKVVRFHLVFRPESRHQAHWNNEAGEWMVWLKAPAGIDVENPRLSTPGPRDAVSTEVRELEGELRIPAGARPGKLEVPAYVLYYVCEGESGACKYLRQDFEFEVVVR